MMVVVADCPVSAIAVMIVFGRRMMVMKDSPGSVKAVIIVFGGRMLEQPALQTAEASKPKRRRPGK